MSKDEYLSEKKLLDEQLSSVAEDIERIKNDLAKVPTEADLENLEVMADKIVTAHGYNLDIPDEDKRVILDMLNVKVLVTPEKAVKVEGWFRSDGTGFISQPST
jgi:hypothetical protein